MSSFLSVFHNAIAYAVSNKPLDNPVKKVGYHASHATRSAKLGLGNLTCRKRGGEVQCGEAVWPLRVGLPRLGMIAGAIPRVELPDLDMVAGRHLENPTVY